MNIDEAIDAIIAAVQGNVTVNGNPLHATDDVGTSTLPPFVVVTPPELDWGEEAFCDGGPSEATFPVVLVMPSNQFTTRDAPSLAAVVARAIQASITDALVGPIVRPVAFTGGTSGEQPGYEIPVNIKLNDG